MSKTIKAISYVSIVAVISKLVGFAREMVIAAYYGASWETDAFNMANSVIVLSTAILSMGIATVIVPMYNHRLVKDGKDEADYFASNILCITSLLYALLSAVGIIFAPYLLRIFAPKFDGELFELSVQLIRILFVSTIATNLTNFLSSVSRSNRRFLVPSLMGFPLSISNILLISILSKHVGIYAMVGGYAIGIILQAVMLVVSLRGVFKFSPVINFSNGDVKKIITLSVPIFFSIGVSEVNAMIDRMLASGLTEGSITAMRYAQRLSGLPEGIITSSIIMVIFPILSQYAAKQDFDNLKALVSKTMTTLFAVMTPIALFCIYYSKEIVKIVYERGAFTYEETAMTANIFIFVIVSLFFSGGRIVLNNAFYGMQDTKTPQIGSVIAVLCNIVLNLILVRYMQAAGLSLATSVSATINFFVLLFFFRHKCGSFGGLAFLRSIIKCTIATAGMLPIFWICEFFREKLPMIIFFGVCAIIGFTGYAALLYIMKVDIFMLGLEKARTFFRRKNNL